MTEGDTVELDKVLLIADDDRVTVGNPTIDGARVLATGQGEGRGDKVIVFRYKPKVRYRKKTGHRQYYTRLAIDKIIEQEAAAGKARGQEKEVTESGA